MKTAHANWQEQRAVVQEILGELGAMDRPLLNVFSKIDALSQPQREALRARIEPLAPNSVFVNSVEPDGLAPLRRALLAAARKGTAVFEIRFSSGNGKLLAQIHREATVLTQKTKNGQLVLTARVENGLVDKLRRAGAFVR